MTFFTTYHDPEQGFRFRLFNEHGQQVLSSDWDKDPEASIAMAVELMRSQLAAAAPIPPANVVARPPRARRRARP